MSHTPVKLGTQPCPIAAGAFCSLTAVGSERWSAERQKDNSVFILLKRAEGSGKKMFLKPTEGPVRFKCMEANRGRHPDEHSVMQLWIPGQRLGGLKPPKN